MSFQAIICTTNLGKNRRNRKYTRNTRRNHKETSLKAYFHYGER